MESGVVNSGGRDCGGPTHIDHVCRCFISCKCFTVMTPEGTGPSECLYQDTHEGPYFIRADSFPPSHFFLQFSASFRVPLLADYAFFLSLCLSYTLIYDWAHAHNTLGTRTHTPLRLYHHQLRTVVSGPLNCFLYSETQNQFAIT